MDDEEHHTGVRCLAAPVHDFSRRVVAALGISGPATNLSAADTLRYAAEVCAARAPRRNTCAILGTEIALLRVGWGRPPLA